MAGGGRAGQRRIPSQQGGSGVMVVAFEGFRAESHSSAGGGMMVVALETF